MTNTDRHNYYLLPFLLSLASFFAELPAGMDAAPHRPGFLARCHVGGRRLAILGICLGVVFLLGWFYAIHRVHEEIRARVEAALAEHYSAQKLSVSVSTARLLEGKGIEIRDLSIGKLRVGTGSDEIVSIDRVFLHCKVTLKDLLEGPPQASRIEIRGLEMTATRDRRGNWDVHRLLPLPKTALRSVPIEITDATVRCIRAANPTAHPFVVRNINLDITPAPIDAAMRTPRSIKDRLLVKGSFSGDHFKQTTVDGWIAKDASSYAFKGSSNDLRLSSDLRGSLPINTPDSLALLESISGRASFHYHVATAGHAERSPRFDLQGSLTEGRVEDPRLPYPLTDLNADLFCSNEGWRVENMTARSGIGTIELTCETAGFDAASPLVLHAKASRLELDGRLADALPESLRAAWEAYSPAGTVNAELLLTRDDNGWRPDLRVECLDVSFAHHLFPYRIDDCIGNVTWKDDRCDINLQALVSARVVNISGRLNSPGVDYTGGIEISMSGPIPVDEKLLSAFSDRHEAFLRSFHPRGWIKADITIRRDDPARAKAEHFITVEMMDCAIRYDRFPYPLEGVRGTLKIENGNWQIINVKGYNDGAEVTCSGTWTRHASGQGNLDLHFVGRDIALEEDELRAALKPEAQKLWNDLRPRGSIDQVVADLTYRSEQRRMSLSGRAEKWKRRDRSEGRGISIEPVWLPYRMDEVTGTVHYHDGAVTLENVSVRHGDTTAAVAGSGKFSPAGWKMVFHDLTVQRLKLNQELFAALPPSLARGLAKLNLTGHMTLVGSIGMAAGLQPRQPLLANWNLYLDVVDGDLDCGIQVHDIHGGVRLIGQHDQHESRSRGEFDIDSLVYKDIQLTDVRGPLWLDKTRVTFGRWAQPRGEAAPPRRVTARIFGGAFETDAQVVFGSNAPFQIHTNLSQIDLKQFAKEKAPRMRNLSGTALADVKLNGTSKGTHTWRGSGWVRLRDARIYEVPVLLSLLKILSIRQPDTVAFNSGDMDFRIHGDHIYFDRMNFSGDAISLRGNGWMNLAGQIDLSFATVLGRNDVYLPIITDALGLASRQFLLIEIDGTLERPNPPSKRVLPALNDSLRQLFPELMPTEADTRPATPTRRRSAANLR